MLPAFKCPAAKNGQGRVEKNCEQHLDVVPPPNRSNIASRLVQFACKRLTPYPRRYLKAPISSCSNPHSAIMSEITHPTIKGS